MSALLDQLLTLDTDTRQEVILGLDPQAAQQLLYEWRFWARPNQVAPEGDWRVFLLLAGRGFGKTRSGAELVREWVERGQCRRLALVAPTAADARDVIVEGESGILAISPPWFMPVYEPSKRRLTWPNGAMATLYSADEPRRLRGPQHDGAWADELAAWQYPETWDMLMFGLRLGDDPRCVVTTTPRPIPIIKELLTDEKCVVTRGSTYENEANLAPQFFRDIIRKYEGSRLGRQELLAEILDDAPGALWKRDQIDSTRVTEHPPLRRIVVAIDPAASTGEGAAETGIIVAGLGQDGHGYVIDDVTLRGSPDTWGSAAVAAYHKHHADRIVGEVNNGGDMVEHVIRTVDKRAAFKSVRASRGKLVRAEPVAALYEQARVHHVGFFGALEDQLCSWEPDIDQSPDRLDALVWAITELMLGGRDVELVPPIAGMTRMSPWT